MRAGLHEADTSESTFRQLRTTSVQTVSENFFIDRFVNTSSGNVFWQNQQTIELEPGALIMNSSVRIGLHMERYSAINRCTIEGPCGIGSFGYWSDADIARYVNVGARAVIGGFEHPTERLCMSGLFWGQNAHLLGVEPLSDFDCPNNKPDAPRTTLESDVWVSANSIVLSGRHLAVGTVIGAGSVVTRDTEPYGIYIGNPARLIRFRFSESLIGELLDSKWWELPPSVLMTLDMEDVESSLDILRTYRLSSSRD